MDTPNIPTPIRIPDFNDINRQDELKEQAAEIAAIVDRDRKRRKRTLNVLFGLLVITTALAGVVFALGRSSNKVMRDTVTTEVRQTVVEQVPTVVRELERQLPGAIQKEVDTAVEESVDERISYEVRPALAQLSRQIDLIETDPGSPPSIRLFSSSEVGQIKKAISVDLPEQANAIQRLAGQMDEIAAVSNAIKGESWNKDKSDVFVRLSSLEDNMAERVAQLSKLSEKLEALVKQVGGAGIKDPCSALSDSESATFRTYSVKEDTTSRLYDLDFKVKLKGVKDRTVRGLTVFRSEAVLFRETDVMMGDTVSFEDNNFRYTLIPIFINRRSLAKDFIGLAISKARKCPTNAAK